MLKCNVAYVPGKHHKTSEDAYCVLHEPKQGLFISATADGVSSAKFGGEGAEIAVESVVNFIFENYPLDRSEILVKSLIRVAYNRALLKIKEQADSSKEELSEYDTTLMVVVFDYTTNHWYYGHVGDGSVIVQQPNGKYIELTPCQRVDQCVLPLRAGPTCWHINRINQEIVSILCCTDGVADIIRQPAIEDTDGLYVPLLMLLSDSHTIGHLKHKGITLTDLVENPKAISRNLVYTAMYRALRKYGLNKSVAQNVVGSIKKSGGLFELLDSITDDKTVLTCSTNVIPSARPPKYYMPPDWHQLSQKRRKLLYATLDTECDQTEIEDAIVTNKPQDAIQKPLLKKIKLVLDKLLRKRNV